MKKSIVIDDYLIFFLPGTLKRNEYGNRIVKPHKTGQMFR